MPSSPAVILMLLASATALDSSVRSGGAGMQLAQVTIRERIIIRVPNMQSRSARRPVAPPAPARPVEWVEKKGPKCVDAGQLGGAIVNQRSVDLVLRGGDRVRATIDGDCPSLGFYGGFYLHPSGDGLVCAGRDTIRTRSGDSCPISRFRRLVVKR